MDKTIFTGRGTFRDNPYYLLIAMFAACGAGLYNDVTEAQKAMKPDICAEYAPDAERHQIYDVLYERYKRIGQI